MKSKLIFTLAALLVVLMSNVYMGRAEEEPFQIVWKKDIGRGIGSYPLEDFQNLYVASDKIGNFLVYKDDYHSLSVLDLNTGEFKNRIEIEMDNDKEIKKFRLLKNNTRLAVWGNNGWIYIFDTQTWTLERKIPGSFDIISEDMTFLVRAAYFFYDYNTLEKINNINPGGPDEGYFKGILSKDSKKLLSINYSSSKYDPEGRTLVKVFDLSTYKEIFVKEYDDAVKVFADDSINNVLVYYKIFMDRYNLKNGTQIDSTYYLMESLSPNKFTKNNKYFFDSYYYLDGKYTSRDIYIIPLDTSKERLFCENKGVFADVGEDYIISWIQADSSNNYTNYLCKIKINDQEVVPVLETSEVTEILYPNPTNSVVVIPNFQLQNINELKVFDEKGSDLSKNCQINILTNGVEVNMSNLLTGIYFIQINNSNSSKSFKVIKN